VSLLAGLVREYSPPQYQSHADWSECVATCRPQRNTNSMTDRHLGRSSTRSVLSQTNGLDHRFGPLPLILAVDEKNLEVRSEPHTSRAKSRYPTLEKSLQVIEPSPNHAANASRHALSLAVVHPCKLDKKRNLRCPCGRDAAVRNSNTSLKHVESARWEHHRLSRF
jgi:hypothetical protein